MKNKKLIEYVVFRRGSNSANQPMCELAPVGILYAHNEREAINMAYGEKWADCYANQHLEIQLATKTSDWALEEAIQNMMDNEDFFDEVTEREDF